MKSEALNKKSLSHISLPSRATTIFCPFLLSFRIDRINWHRVILHEYPWQNQHQIPRWSETLACHELILIKFIPPFKQYEFYNSDPALLTICCPWLGHSAQVLKTINLTSKLKLNFPEFTRNDTIGWIYLTKQNFKFQGFALLYKCNTLSSISNELPLTGTNFSPSLRIPSIGASSPRSYFIISAKWTITTRLKLSPVSNTTPWRVLTKRSLERLPTRWCIAHLIRCFIYKP